MPPENARKTLVFDVFKRLEMENYAKMGYDNFSQDFFFFFFCHLILQLDWNLDFSSKKLSLSAVTSLSKIKQLSTPLEYLTEWDM